MKKKSKISTPLNPHLLEEKEFYFEKKIRPTCLKEYMGQLQIVEELTLLVEAARKRFQPLDHVLLAGPPGLGKTTLAHVIAFEMKAQLHCVTGPTLEKKADLASLLTQLSPGDVLFIDEIHRLQKPIEEVLYGAMEDFKLDLIIGQGPGTRTLRMDLAHFTLIGATTRSGLLSHPFRDRFGIHFRLDFYPSHELQHILIRSAECLRVPLEHSGAKEIAQRARGIPRIANRLLRRVRDYFEVKGEFSSINKEVVHQALSLFGIDHRGLDAADRKYLILLVEKFNNGPVGIETLSSALGENKETLEDVYEPYLIQEGLLQRTPRGRIATLNAQNYLKNSIKS